MTDKPAPAAMQLSQMSIKTMFDMVDRCFKLVQWLFILAVLRSGYLVTDSLIFGVLYWILYFFMTIMLLIVIERVADRLFILKRPKKRWLLSASILVSVLIAAAGNIALQLGVQRVVDQITQLQGARRG